MKTYVACVGAQWGDRVLDNLGDLRIRRINANAWAGLKIAMSVVRFRPRYLFFLNWSWILPSSFVDNFECVNFHATKLPYGRGGGPLENLILRGHTETVITAHRMTDEIDAGPIYQVSPPVSLAGTKDEILARFVEPVADLMRWIVESEPEPVPQVGEVVRFKRLPKDEYERFWKERRS